MAVMQADLAAWYFLIIARKIKAEALRECGAAATTKAGRMDARVSQAGTLGAKPLIMPQAGGTAMLVLSAISLSHGLNDIIQSLVPALYPLMKSEFSLDFSQVGLIGLTFQLTASLLQPVVGLYTDRHPKPFSLPIGMACTLMGLLLLSVAWTYPILLVSAALVGIGSSIFHPESSRVARMASGGRHGFAQSLFQLGGNFGTAIGPLLAAYIVVPRGQSSIAYFSGVALLAILILSAVGRWYKARLMTARKTAAPPPASPFSPRKVGFAIAILMTLVFSKHFYLASIGSYYPFFLMSRFGIDQQTALVHLFIFLGAVAAGTILGGPIGDRFGRKLVIWVSILGVLPFTLMLPYANLFWTTVLSVVIGLILSSAFSAILVFAQELVPGKIGMISGLFFGLAFGMGGLGAAVLGVLADHTSIDFVYKVCAYLPALGLLAAFLPKIDRRRS
jgi:FSR family fosmidomycin resistance protein-like MFS transporter